MIHKYAMNGVNTVIDVYSGAIHRVERIVYDILDHYGERDASEIAGILKNEYTEDDIYTALSEIRELEGAGLLFSESGYITGSDRGKPVVKALCLLISQDCNMNCAYCFAGEGEYKSRNKRSMMSLETGRKAVDFLIKNSGNRRNLEIDFFGGEPLMNLDVIKGIAEYARGKEAEHGKLFRFTLTTNGVLLDDGITEYINENMQNVVLSIDGRREVNDRMRRLRNGQGSYDLIVPKIKKVAESRNQENYYVRGTYTRESLDFAADVLHLAGLGFRQISVEPVVASGDEGYSLRREDLPGLFAEYEKLAQKMLEMPEGERFNFFHFTVDLSGGPCVHKRITGCGAGTEYLSVTAEGELYPCHQFTGIGGFRLGTLDGGITETELCDKIRGSNINTKEKCAGCWAKFYCGGGCMANAFMENGDINVPYEIGCELQRKRTECAVMMKVKARNT